MRTVFKQHINTILLTVLVHLFIVFVLLLLEVRTEVIYSETPLLIDPEMLMEDEPEELDQHQIDDIDVERFLANMTSAGSNYRGVNENLRDNKDLSLDEIRKMYEEEILREKYGDDYEKPIPNDNTNNTDNTSPIQNAQQNNNSNQHIDNSDKPCLVKAILDDKNRQTRYLHIPVFTCRGSGTIEIGISISPEGKVTHAKLLSAGNSTDRDCLVEAALSAARKSRFAIVVTQQNQSGKIVYTFMNQ